MFRIAKFHPTRRPLSALVAVVAVAALALAWGGVALELHLKRTDAVQAEVRQNANLARALQEQTLRVIAAVDQAMLRVRDAVIQGHMEPEHLKQLADETGLSPRILVQLSMVGPDGRFIASNLDLVGRNTGRLDLSDREHVRIHLQPDSIAQAGLSLNDNGLFIGKPVLGKVSGRWTIQLSRRIETNGGQVLGIVVASLDPGYFEEVYRGVELGAQGTVTLSGTDGVVRVRVVGGVSQGMGSAFAPNAALMLRLRNRETTGNFISVSTIDQVERIVAFHQVGDSTLYISVATATSEALAFWRSTRGLMLSLTALLSLAILAAAAVFLTAVRRMEQKNEILRVSEARAQAASDAKSAFLANVSHEIRTPLNAVIGFTHLMLRDSTDQRQTERLSKVSTAAHHLLGLINNILDVSRIEAGKLQLNTADFEVRRMVDDICSLVRDEAEAKGLALATDLGDLPQTLHGDALRLGQILLNFLGNAVKFTDTGRIRLASRVVSQDSASLVVRFEVSDSGIGLTEQQRRRLFQHFEQADSSISRKYGGTGLGLAICRQLAELMGGRIGVDSMPGAGSTFWVEIPMRRGMGNPASQSVVPAAALARLEVSMARHAGQRIILAEDNQVNQEIMREYLGRVGLEVELAKDGQAAVDLAETGGFDLILMDVQMPILDGWAATRLIRTRPQCASLPIVAMTASALDEDRERCLAAGMNDHIAKPVEPAALYRTLLRWLPEPDAAAGRDPVSVLKIDSPGAVSEPADLPEHASRQAGAVVKQLERLLADDDVASVQFFQNNKMVLNALLKSEIRELGRYIEGYDFGAALTALRQAPKRDSNHS